MKIRTMRYFISESLQSFWRNSFMSIASIATVALSLFILGIFMTMVANLDYFVDNLESQVQISVYLKDDLTTDQVMSVGKRLKELPDVKEIQFTNKDQAMDALKERMKDQPGILAALDGKNPLPSSYEITFTNPEAVKKTAAIVANYPEVESSHYGQAIVEQLFKITTIIRWGGIALIIFLTLATLFIISNTIRLTVFARRKEIGIMKYVGATNWFIRWPFLLEGLLLGFIGGLIADFALFQFYEFVTVAIHESLAFLPLVSIYPFMYQTGGILLVISMIIGAIGSTISLKRYMKV
ncbi:permease-like cell division protein FtsX [Megasphaera cerevisiae]|jgi:cell division transport system permease protein|uniref:permease-like cell division protein FtsX n=1 Tax=Megasphaera cerevisiae TaxID=39029 RepID=UPI000944C809|nr:permease-like cell division protein FtsX [Megasphaera cerevisiae]MCI1750701.1 permease-like cell division protein FtsX [Megasphaera cerevisiae]OKY54484.1 cell division protein FtsX [Megasphaera cerevisiae]